MRNKRRWYDWIAAGLGLCVFLWGAAVWSASNTHLGHIMMTGLGVLLLGWGLAGPWVRRKIPRFLRMALYVLLALGLGLCGMLFAYGASDTVDYTEDAVIVLGAGLRGEDVTLILARRLDAAMDYAERNPSAYIVVSGGQGPDEVIPESLAMYRYLVDHGMDPQRILVEDRSTSTRENFRYSKELLDSILPAGYRVAYVTTDFHSYRAGAIATEEGLTARRLSSRTDWYLAPSNVLREAVAVLKLWTWDAWFLA